MFAIYKIGNLICCWAAPSSNVQKLPYICVLAFSEFEMKQRKISSCCFFEVLSRNSFFSLSWWIFMGIQMISQVILHNYIIFLNSISIARHAWERERPPPPKARFLIIFPQRPPGIDNEGGYRSIPAKLDGSPVECSIQNLRAELNASQKEEVHYLRNSREVLSEFRNRLKKSLRVQFCWTSWKVMI